MGSLRKLQAQEGIEGLLRGDLSAVHIGCPAAVIGDTEEEGGTVPLIAHAFRVHLYGTHDPAVLPDAQLQRILGEPVPDLP